MHRDDGPNAKLFSYDGVRNFVTERQGGVITGTHNVTGCGVKSTLHYNHGNYLLSNFIRQGVNGLRKTNRIRRAY